MTIPEAIKFNEALRKDLVQKGMQTYAEAVGLGGEAMKLVQSRRVRLGITRPLLLPGETKE